MSVASWPNRPRKCTPIGIPSTFHKSLGFDSHPDFAAAAGHLGSWIGPSPISFGKDGKPLYVFGPYDEHRSVVRTLQRTVGRGNFEVVAITG